MLFYSYNPVGTVLRRTRPNARCIPNRAGLTKERVKPNNFLKLNDLFH